MSKRIQSIIDDIKSRCAFHDRITIGVIQKFTGYYNLYQNRLNLPKCFEIMDRECESRIDYQKRRVDYVMYNMAKNSEKITYNKVLHSTGLGRYKNHELNEYVMTKLDEYNQGSTLK